MFVYGQGTIIAYTEVSRETTRYMINPKIFSDEMKSIEETSVPANDWCDSYLPFIDRETLIYTSGSKTAERLDCCPVVK